MVAEPGATPTTAASAPGMLHVSEGEVGEQPRRTSILDEPLVVPTEQGRRLLFTLQGSEG